MNGSQGRRSKRGWGATLASVALLAIAVAVPVTAQSPSAGTEPAGSAGASTCEVPSTVSIVNREMSHDDIVAAIQAEGSLVVGNWTYTANDELVKQFTQYVKDTYGVDIQFTYDASQQPSTYLTNLYAAQRAGNPPAHDVLAIEENYWAEAMENDAVESFLPSALVPNQCLVLDQFQHAPTSIAFQSTAFPAIIYSKANASFLTKLMDLADPRLKGKVTLPLPGDITAGGFFIGLAAELGKDYADPAQMREVVDWAIENIGPNVLKYTTDSSEMQTLLRSGDAWAVSFWNSLARLEYFGDNTDAALLLPAEVFPANGYLWIPKGVQHPVLAQIFIDWRLRPDVQFPNAWPIDHGPWAELSEGFLGEAYVDQVPDWFQADYNTYYPTLDQIQTQFKSVDWDAYNAAAADWQDYYAEKLGL